MTKKCKINLALQGGGSFGAFTWGALDRLLQADCLDVEAVSGASAGALNAAVFITGYEQAGAPGARSALESFWRDVSCMSPGLGYFKSATEIFTAPFKAASKIFSTDYLSHANPLQPLIKAHVDCNLIRRSGIKCFVSATNVRTGLPRIFESKDISLDALLASACLPQMFHAIEIDGEAYWDGDYSSNPPILPLVERCNARDVLLVQLNAAEASSVPKTQSEVVDRAAEIKSNAPLLAELRAVRLALKDGQSMFLHRIVTPEAMRKLPMTSRLDTSARLILDLQELGRQAAESWLADNFAKVGVESSSMVEA